MPYQPPWPLPVPSSLTAVPDCIGRLDLDSLGLMSSQEQTSNDQLQHNVRDGGPFSPSAGCSCHSDPPICFHVQAFCLGTSVSMPASFADIPASDCPVFCIVS